MSPEGITGARILLWAVGMLYVIGAVTLAVLNAIGKSRANFGDDLYWRLWMIKNKLLLLIDLSPSRIDFAKRFLVPVPQIDAPQHFVEFPKPVLSKLVSQIRSNGRVFVTGQSGSGKSTFLSHYLALHTDKQPASAVKLPVFIPVSLLNSTGDLSRSIVTAIKAQMSSRYAVYRAIAAASLLRRGKLTVIFDDLDYFDSDRCETLNRFAKKWHRNSFAFVRSRRFPVKTFLDEIEMIVIPPWGHEEIEQYLTKRFHQRDIALELIRLVELHDASRESSTPLAWKRIADAWLNHQVFDIFKENEGSGGEKLEARYQINNAFLTIRLKHARDYSPSLEAKLGHLALRLIKEGSSAFYSNQTSVPITVLEDLSDSIFLKEEGRFSFRRSDDQVLLAGRFIGQHWNEAETELHDHAAQTLLWTSVYEVAKAFTDRTGLDRLVSYFSKLAEGIGSRSLSRG